MKSIDISYYSYYSISSSISTLLYLLLVGLLRRHL
jgi:hypothetical protein